MFLNPKNAKENETGTTPSKTHLLIAMGVATFFFVVSGVTMKFMLFLIQGLYIFQVVSDKKKVEDKHFFYDFARKLQALIFCKKSYGRDRSYEEVADEYTKFLAEDEEYQPEVEEFETATNALENALTKRNETQNQ